MKCLGIKQLDGFKCIADKCTYTCCRGWIIAIDDKAEMYKQMGYEDRIVYENGRWRMKLNPDGRCAMLDQRGLCKLVLEHGEEVLSATCSIYPRVINKTKDTIELSYNNDCPAVISALRELKDSLVFEMYEIEEDVPIRIDENERYYAIRDMVIDLLQISDIPVWVRLMMCYQFIEKTMSEDSVYPVIEKYNDVNFIIELYNQILGIKCGFLEKGNYIISLVLQFIKRTTDDEVYNRYIGKISDYLSTVTIQELDALWSEYQKHKIENEMLYENLLVNAVFINIMSDSRLGLRDGMLALIFEYSAIMMTHFLYWCVNEKVVDIKAENDIICYFARLIEKNASKNMKAFIESYGNTKGNVFLRLL